ncbi:MAG: matrixin family metalloprotease [Sandaracinaceae bacterium]
MKLPSVLLALLTLGLAPLSANAQECISDECSVWCDPASNVVRYQVGALPVGLDETAAISEIQRAAEQFNALPCSAPTFEYVGRVADGATAPVVFEAAETATPPSVASVRWGECLLDARIELADVEGWSADAASGAEFDVYTVALYGFGHALGLRSRQSDTAFGLYQGARTDLSEGDIEAVCSLYGREDVAVSVADAGPADASWVADGGMAECGGGCAVSPRRTASVGLSLLLGFAAVLLGRRRRGGGPAFW